VALWALSSALAILTHFFAGFLVAPEALWLLWRLRNKDTGTAVAAVIAVQLAVLPMAISDTSQSFGAISSSPLSIRVGQIPVALGASQLYQSPQVSWGLPGAGILLALVIALVWLGGSAEERRGAWRAGAIAAFALLLPIAVAQFGHDYVFARNFMPVWIPLAVLVGAACTTSRARVPGAILALVLVAGFLWAGAKIDSSPAYERPDWRGAALALGTSPRPRAILAYDGNAAEQPLAIYLPRTQFSYSGMPRSNAPTSVWEVDVVGNAGQTVAAHLPSGVRLISSTAVNGILVVRFALARPWRLPPTSLAARAPALVGPAPTGHPSVLIQT